MEMQMPEEPPRLLRDERAGLTPADHRRRQRRERKERMRANGPVEKIDRDGIGDRDGWVCGLCSDPVDPALRHPDPRSPSLDHIRPISTGGTHTRDNAQITHLGCNTERNSSSEITSLEEAERHRQAIASIPGLAEYAASMDLEEKVRRSRERHRPEVFREALRRQVERYMGRQSGAP